MVRKLVVLLLCALLMLALQTEAARERSRSLDDDDDDDDDDRDYSDSPSFDDRQADKMQARMASNAVGEISVAEQLANVADLMPLSEYFMMRVRILKLNAFCSQLLHWLQKDVGAKSPMDKVALVTLFIIGSYVPALIASIVYSMTCKKEQKPKFDPALFTFNKPDA